MGRGGGRMDVAGWNMGVRVEEVRGVEIGTKCWNGD